MPSRPTTRLAQARRRQPSALPADVSRPAPDLPTPLLGGLTPAQFMRRYWQRKPLLIRQALPQVAGVFTRAALQDLATHDDVESRLVTRTRNRWRLETGPFDAEEFEALPTRLWTLLVQGVNLHDTQAHQLLNRFRFIPDARLDDLMISYAADGGGVGPHVDSYDVFLLQAHGRRRWRIGAQADLTLAPGLPLKILQTLQVDEEWVLEPGDMLYLPPHIAHEGMALGDCITCSIGFRAPAAAQLTAEFLYHLAERAIDDTSAGLYADPGQPPTTTPARIPERMQRKIAQTLSGIRWSAKDVHVFIGQHLSEPKAHVFFDPPARLLHANAFISRCTELGMTLDKKTVMLYDDHSFYVNGETVAIPRSGANALRDFADSRQLTPKNFVTLSNDSSMAPRLHEWYRAGWIRVGRA